MEQNTESSLFVLQVDHQGTTYLSEAARWAKFIAIVGFIFCGLILIVALFAGSIFASLGRLGGGLGGGVLGAGFGAMISVIYILVALLYFFPCLYLFNFASKMQVAIRSNEQEQLNQAFKSLKSCYRFIGILLIICLGLWALGFILAIVGAAFR